MASVGTTREYNKDGLVYLVYLYKLDALQFGLIISFGNLPDRRRPRETGAP